MSQKQCMAKRNQLRSLLCRRNTGNSGNLQRVAFGVMSDLAKCFCVHPDMSFGNGLANSVGFARNIHHPDAAFRIIMAETLGHNLKPRIDWLNGSLIQCFNGITSTHSPVSRCARSGCTTRNELAAARPTRSPEPCHLTGLTVGTPSSESTHAGTKVVSSGLRDTELARRARKNRGLRNPAPESA